jgi:hypothetical protein
MVDAFSIEFGEAGNRRQRIENARREDQFARPELAAIRKHNREPGGDLPCPADVSGDYADTELFSLDAGCSQKIAGVDAVSSRKVVHGVRGVVARVPRVQDDH